MQATLGIINIIIEGSVKLAVDSDSYWVNAMIGMYLGKRKVALYIGLHVAPSRYRASLGGLLQNTTREYLPESVCVYVHPCVCVCVCLSVCLSVCVCMITQKVINLGTSNWNTL